jgi:hypothetical protein
VAGIFIAQVFIGALNRRVDAAAASVMMFLSARHADEKNSSVNAASPASIFTIDKALRVSRLIPTDVL